MVNIARIKRYLVIALKNLVIILSRDRITNALISLRRLICFFLIRMQQYRFRDEAYVLALNINAVSDKDANS